MHTSHPVSLLVAALVMLRQPCARNRSAARLLLERAAEHAELTPAEREACRSVADDLCSERHETGALRAHWLLPSPIHPQGASHACPRKEEAAVAKATGRKQLRTTDAKASTTSLTDWGGQRRLNLVSSAPPLLEGVTA